MNRNLCSALLGVALVGGCTLAPRYQRPVSPVPNAWPSGPAYSSTNAPAKPSITNGTPTTAIGWRDFFQDPRLRQLIEIALRNNRDLRVAVLEVQQAQAQYRIQRSPLLPTIEATGRAVQQQFGGSLSGAGGSFSVDQYSVTLGSTAYELDLFGRIRSLKHQALEQYFATKEARMGAQIALVAEVAIQYLDERALDEQLTVARRTLNVVTASLDLIRSRYQLGDASELDLRTAEAQAATARANIAAYTRQRAQAKNALVLLLGQALPDDLAPSPSLESETLLENLPADLPSNLLERRPDILAAEHRLKAANADIGAARAAFFPKITLTGYAGLASLGLNDLISPDSEAWNFAPQITVPLFTYGKNVANLDLAKVRRKIEVATYEKAIQTAFREVADALAARATLLDQSRAVADAAAAEQRRYHLAELRYRHGVDSYLAVLTAQQDLYRAQTDLIQTRFSRLANLITLYKALGGGWQEQTTLSRGHSSDKLEQP